MTLPRRRFLHLSAGLGAGTLALAGFGLPAQTARASDDNPPLSDDLVYRFVLAGHGDLAAVRTMLSDEPALLNATHDWGGGDFETALGGASHVGNREIAEALIGHGARIDLFAATMLGMTDVVEPMLARFPTLALAAGPHGLDLLHHAEKGGSTPMIDLVRDAMTAARATRRDG